MDWYPLINSVRIALISTVLVGVVGIAVAAWLSSACRLLKSCCDALFTLPLVLPPTVIGYLLLLLLGPAQPFGAFLLDHFGLRLVMSWPAALIATTVVCFPLMYRTARGAFELFDETLADAARVLGRSSWWIFWHVKFPVCKQGIIAGFVLTFARALGEYGATSMLCGYIPGSTATISTTVYHLWRTGDNELTMMWVLLNIGISACVLFVLNYFESKRRHASRGWR